MAEFDKAFDIVIGEEGGYVNDPNDPGGETKFGISKRSYPDVDIPNLSVDAAKAIYLRDYWYRLHLDSEPWAIALLLFDTAVNQGASYAATLPDNPHDIAVSRALRYAANPNFLKYGHGWFNRLFSIYAQALREPLL